MTNFEKAQKLVEITLSIYSEMTDNTQFGHYSDWEFHIKDDNSSSFGLCNFTKQAIILDRRVLEHGTWDEIKEVVLHECAHALAGIEFKNGRVIAHGKTWRQWATRLGCPPRATASLNPEIMNAYTKKAKYHIISIIDDVITVHGQANRKLKSLSERYYKNVPNSLGNLYMIDASLYSSCNDKDVIKHHAFQ